MREEDKEMSTVIRGVKGSEFLCKRKSERERMAKETN